MIYICRRGGISSPLRGGTFTRLAMLVGDNSSHPNINLRDVLFGDEIKLHATGMLFDARGSGAVHDVKPGFYLGIGEHEAGIGNVFSEKTSRDVTSFESGLNAGGITVVIRAAPSDFSRRTSVEGR